VQDLLRDNHCNAAEILSFEPYSKVIYPLFWILLPLQSLNRKLRMIMVIRNRIFGYRPM